MTIAKGSEVYNLGAAPVKGCGITWTVDELDEALKGPVSDIVFDTAGKSEVEELLNSVSGTDFKKSAALEKIFIAGNEPEEWRVGEAIAEAYLTEHHKCEFPWPDGRDERKYGSSLPGADLVGFQNENASDRFAFGEVKTSSEEKHPPGTMYGPHGLKQQMEDLQDKKGIRDALFMYLGHRATGQPWAQRFKNAASHYLACDTDVALFGILVRDVHPHEDDLKARVKKLAGSCPEKMVIDLIAIYLPKASISKLGKAVVSSQDGDTP